MYNCIKNYTIFENKFLLTVSFCSVFVQPLATNALIDRMISIRNFIRSILKSYDLSEPESWICASTIYGDKTDFNQILIFRFRLEFVGINILFSYNFNSLFIIKIFLMENLESSKKLLELRAFAMRTKPLMTFKSKVSWSDIEELTI